MALSKNTYSRKVRDSYNQNNPTNGINIPAGIYLGIVVSNVDPQPELGLGRIKVHISSLYAPIVPMGMTGASSSTNSGSTPSQSSDPNISATAEEFLGAVWCLRITPFGGTYTDGAGNQMSSGIYYPAPDVGNEVVVAFSGDFDKGIILGVIPSRIENMAGPTAKQTTQGTVAPSYDVPNTKTREGEKAPEHPQATALREQGLDKDSIRGPSQSNPMRDSNAKIVGISSPAGHSLTLDDGFAEDDINNSIRIRTGRGAQILMDDNHGFVYIINQNGSAWMEFNRNGDIDIFSGGSINIHTAGNFNVHSDGSINFQAQAGINMKTCGNYRVETSGGNIDMYSSNNINITADVNGNLKMPGGIKVTSDRIDLNGPVAETAEKPESGALIGNKNVTESISGRVPEREPWSGHLDYGVVNVSTGGLTGDQSTYPGGQIDPQGANVEYPPADPNFPSGLIRFQDHVNRRIDPSLLSVVEDIARQFGRPLIISSGFRTPTTNKGAKASMHLKGRAVDISSQGLSNADRLELISIASSKGIGGIGVYSGGSLHFDNGSRRAWGDSFSYDRSIPSYARAALAAHAGKASV